MIPTLRLGSIGPHVATLQSGLNQLPSSLPRLGVDSVFGALTQGRVTEFQKLQRLGIDGVVGELTWAVLLQLLPFIGAALAASVSTVSDPIRASILAIARRHIGLVDFAVIDRSNRPKGIDLVKDIFQEAAQTTVTDNDFRTKGGWSTSPILHGDSKDWCGLFVIFCYRRAGLKQFSWDLNHGRPVGPLQLNTFSRQFAQNIKPADMATINAQNHHFMVEQVIGSGPAPRIQSLEGNQTLGRIGTGTHQVGVDNFNYYSFT